MSLDIVILGLSITSSWGNGHATTYRGLLRELSSLGHRTLFLERDVEWYAAHRDLPNPPYGRTELYASLPDLRERFEHEVGSADAVIVGSYVPEGIEVGDWVRRVAGGLVAFYDIDTPVTMSSVLRDACPYLHRRQVAQYDLYLSFSGGPILDTIERELGSPAAVPLYCSFDPDSYFPEETERRWDLGYLGTYSEDRQPALERLLIAPASSWRSGRFVVAGPQYPEALIWPRNVERLLHIPPADHRAFYNAQRFTLNVTRADMVRAGWSPSVRLFEAAACATPIVSDWWEGLDRFFSPGEEVLIPESAGDALKILHTMPEDERRGIGARARARVLAQHTAAHRARELESYLQDAS